MALKINEFINRDGEVVKAANKRAVKVLLVGARYLESEKVDPKTQLPQSRGMILVFADSVCVDEKSGQPIITSFTPIIQCYVKNPKEDVLALANAKVFTPYTIVISGNEDFTTFHKLLTDEQAKLYREMIEDNNDLI